MPRAANKSGPARVGGRKKTIVVIEKYPVARAGLVLFLQQAGLYWVAFAGASSSEAATYIAKECPDIVLLSADLRRPADMQAVSIVRAASPQAGVLVLTESDDPVNHRRAMQSGASGVFSKNHGCELLLKAIAKVIEGEIWFDQSVIRAALEDLWLTTQIDRDEIGKVDSLTRLEREIITLVCEGLRNRDIADRLFISEKTVRNQMVPIFSKLHVSSRLALSTYAHGHGLKDG